MWGANWAAGLEGEVCCAPVNQLCGLPAKRYCTLSMLAPASMPAPVHLTLSPTLPIPGRFELVWRPEAKVSVFDSGFMLGDGVWEGIRLHRGVLLFLQVCCCCPTVAAFDTFRRPSCH